MALEEELEQAAENLAKNTFGLVPKDKQLREKNVLRRYLKRVRYFLYYRVNDDGDVFILSLWQASQRDEPKL